MGILINSRSTSRKEADEKKKEKEDRAKTIDEYSKRARPKFYE
jgi:hypothetical protein